MLLVLRTIIFHIAVFLFTLVYSPITVCFIFFLPFDWKYKQFSLYSRTIIFLAKFICGIKYEVHGLENLNKHQAFIVLSKHQSQWETFFLVNHLHPLIYVCKKELLKLPMLVGLGIKLMKPITVDRTDLKGSLKQIISQGRKRLLEDKLPVLMFPEGKRTKPGEKVAYARSGAALAIETGVPVIYISHDAGKCWPADTLLKYPGTIQVHISEPVFPEGMDSKKLTHEARNWIESH